MRMARLRSDTPAERVPVVPPAVVPLVPHGSVDAASEHVDAIARPTHCAKHARDANAVVDRDGFPPLPSAVVPLVEHVRTAVVVATFGEHVEPSRLPRRERRLSDDAAAL